MNRSKTDFLVASSSFWGGFGSVLNIRGRGPKYNRTSDPDKIAIAQDWVIVGQDIRDALGKIVDLVQLEKSGLLLSRSLVLGQAQSPP